MSQLWLSTRFQPRGMPPLPAWLTIAQINPCFSIVGKSAGPSSSTDLSPMRFAFAASSSRGISLKHHRQTDCLIVLAGLAGCDADVPVPAALIAPLAAPPEVPLDAQADAVAPSPTMAPSVTPFCTNSRRVGMKTSLFRMRMCVRPHGVLHRAPREQEHEDAEGEQHQPPPQIDVGARRERRRPRALRREEAIAHEHDAEQREQAADRRPDVHPFR